MEWNNSSSRKVIKLTDNQLENTEDIYRYFQNFFKPPNELRIGVEHEFFMFNQNLERVTYNNMPLSIQDIFTTIKNCGWKWSPYYEYQHTIELTKDGDKFSLEAGGQLEFSSAAVHNIHEISQQLQNNIEFVKNITNNQLILVGVGYDPKTYVKNIRTIPKKRYEYMLNYLSYKGENGYDMLHSTASIQASLDYRSEEDLIKKLRVSTALQPIVGLLFACSPIVEEKITPYQSYRNYIWTDVDKQRSGISPFICNSKMNLEYYINYILDIPMIFIIRNGSYIDPQGQTFRDFLKGSLRILPQEKPTTEDLTIHLSTLYSDVRLKSVLEMRGADSCPFPYLQSLAAFWVGLLYQDEVLSSVFDLIDDWAEDDYKFLRMHVPMNGFKTVFRGKSIHSFVENVLELSKTGLEKRSIMDRNGNTEAIYLSPLNQIVQSRETLSDQMNNDYKKLDFNTDNLIRKWAY